MRLSDKIYIDGSFVTPHGTELFDLHNPATAQVIGRVRLAEEEDARTAIAAAKRAFPAFSRTSRAERIALLRRMHAAMKARREDLLEAIVEEYGAPVSRAGFMADHPANVLLDMARVLEDYRFTRRVGHGRGDDGALGRRRSHHAVEQRCRLHLRQARCRNRGWLHGGRQAK